MQYVKALITRIKGLGVRLDNLGLHSYVIDCGPDLDTNAHQTVNMDGVLYSRTCRSYGWIDDIRPFNFKQGKIPIYAKGNW
jgi:hypothetical protein